MKKLTLVATLLALCIGFGTVSAFADTATAVPTTGDWVPHNYVLSGYDIPTAMEYSAENGTVTFKGSLNAGIATTGFNYAKPIDLNNFVIDMDVVIPEIDNLAWISMGFLDTNLVTDAENSLAPVAMPFNAMSGKGGYSNSEMTGVILQIFTNQKTDGVGTTLANDNVMAIALNEKNLDTTTGEKHTNGWNAITSTAMIEAVKLNDTFDGSLKISVNSTETGLAFNLNDGAWVGMDEEGNYTVTSDRLNAGSDLAGLKSYFADKDCYFSFALMYSDGTHREVSLTVNTVNGQPASDGSAPAYAEAKVFEKDNIKVTFDSSSIGAFGVYPSAITDVNVTKFGEDDGDWEAAATRASAIGMEIVDFFRITPVIGTATLSLAKEVDVEYTLPEGYESFKVYFINEDDEAQALNNVYAVVENGKATIKVDNDLISKVIIYGQKPGAGNSAGGSTEGKGGCGGVAAAGSVLGVVMLGAFALLKKRG